MAEGFRQGRLAAEKGYSMKKCPYERCDTRRKGYRRGLRYERSLQDAQERELLEQRFGHAGFKQVLDRVAMVTAREAAKKPPLLRELTRLYKTG